MPKPLAFSGKQNSELVTRGMKILSTYFARKTKDGISDLEDSVSDRCDLLTSQEADVIVYQMGWYTSSELGWGRTWTNMLWPVSACQKRAICPCSQPMQSYTFHDRSLANGKSVPLWFDSMIVHYLQKKAGPTPGRRGGCRVRARQLAAAAAASGRPVARSLPSLGPLPLSQAVARSRPLAPRRFGEVPETIPLHLQRRGKHCKQRGLAEIVPYSSQIAVWQSHIYSSTVTAIRLIFNVIFGTMSRASKATRALARARLRAVVAKRRGQKFHQLVMHGNYKQLRYSSFKKQFSWQRQLGYFFRSCFVFRCSFFGFSTGNKNEIKMELLLDQDTGSMDMCQDILQLGHAAWTGR